MISRVRAANQAFRSAAERLTRAAQVMIAALIARFLPMSEA
jgi:hypothetical protein